MSATFVPYLGEIASFKERLLTLPQALLTARRALSDATERESDATRVGAERKAELEWDVLHRVGPDNKPAFTNEAARKSALAKACAEDAPYQAALKATSAAKSERQQAALEVQRLEDEQRGLRAVVDLVCAQTQLLLAGRD